MCVVKLEATPNRMWLSRIELLKATPKHCDRVLFCRINIKNYSFGICNFLEWKEKTWLLLITINAKRGGVENLSHGFHIVDLFLTCPQSSSYSAWHSARWEAWGWGAGGDGKGEEEKAHPSHLALPPRTVLRAVWRQMGTSQDMLLGIEVIAQLVAYIGTCKGGVVFGFLLVNQSNSFRV